MQRYASHYYVIPADDLDEDSITMEDDRPIKKSHSKKHHKTNDNSKSHKRPSSNANESNKKSTPNPIKRAASNQTISKKHQKKKDSPKIADKATAEEATESFEESNIFTFLKTPAFVINGI